MNDIKNFEATVMLDLSAGERELIKEYIEDLENGFTALEPIATGGTEPLTTVLDEKNILRDDVASKTFTRDEILSNAPEQNDGFFVVPGTI